MADLNFASYYTLSYNPGNGGTFTVGANTVDDGVLTEATNDMTLTQGEAVSISGTTAPLNGYVYYGQAADGMLLFRVPGNNFGNINASTQWIGIYPDDTGAASSSNFAASSVNTSNVSFCFLEGTLIRTPEGDRPVEALAVGDLVMSAEGKAVPVKWMGRQTFHPLFASLNGSLPVCVRAGALGGGLPQRDLFLSPGHALLVDGVLVRAEALVNGASIVQLDPQQGDIRYFHIELDNHELVLAEGTPAETFVDNVTRAAFDNFDEFVELYGEEAPIAEMTLPVVKSPRQLSAHTRNRLMSVAQELFRKAA